MYIHLYLYVHTLIYIYIQPYVQHVDTTQHSLCRYKSAQQMNLLLHFIVVANARNNGMTNILYVTYIYIYFI